MLRIFVENISDLAIIECEGRIVRSDDAFALRKAVIMQADARIIVLDLSETRVIEGGGLGMLLFLQRWAHEHHIKLKLFNPTNLVKFRLERVNPIPQFDFVPLNEMMALLAISNHRYAAAA